MWRWLNLIGATLGGYVLGGDERRLRTAAEERQRQKENDRRFKEFLREHERRMLEKYGENWRDHEPKEGVLRMISYGGYDY